MAEPEGTYRPRSPDLSAYSTFPPEQCYGSSYHRASYDSSPYFSPQSQQAPPQAFPFYSSPDTMVRTTRNSNKDDVNWAPQVQTTKPRRGRRPTAATAAAAAAVTAAATTSTTTPTKQIAAAPLHPLQPSPMSTFTPQTTSSVHPNVEIKTKFPVARIKRIMQADEEVGKVSQVTPIAVSKALELFMVNLVTKAAYEARTRSSKRVTAAHLKAAVMKDDTFDFLRETVARVPDAPTPGEKRAAADDDSEELVGGRRRRSQRGRRRRENGDY